MGEGGAAKQALRNRDVVAAKECFVASPACLSLTNVNGACDGFAIGDIECIAADGARVGHI
jgi:hypothetical protein